MTGTMMGYTHAHSIFIIIYWQFSRLGAHLCSRGQTLGLTPLCTSSWRRRDAFIPFSCVFPATLSPGNHHFPFHLGKFTRYEADYLLPLLLASKQKAICSFSAIRCRVVESSCKERARARSALPLLAVPGALQIIVVSPMITGCAITFHSFSITSFGKGFHSQSSLA